ncbi:unnamed protein product [Auanema sp. JU1783]|nr:unnamed protein product [Auanema sp. JU1783]
MSVDANDTVSLSGLKDSDKKEQLKKMKKLSYGPAKSPRYEFTMNRSFSKSFEKSRSASVSSTGDSQLPVPVVPPQQPAKTPLKRIASLDIKGKPKGFLTAF